MDLVNNFYKKILKNIHSNATFMLEDRETFTYRNILDFNAELQGKIKKLVK